LAIIGDKKTLEISLELIGSGAREGSILNLALREILNDFRCDD
jgi:hypothetical protein